jgi:hypothetical protein
MDLRLKLPGVRRLGPGGLAMLLELVEGQDKRDYRLS